MLRPPHRLLWTLVWLTRARLAKRELSRVGLALAALVALAVGISAIVVHLIDGAEANLGGAVARASTWVAWLGAGPVALAAADGQAARDRADGIDALAATRGAPSAWLVAGRTLAVMAQVALVIAAPLTALALIAAGLAPSAAAVWRALTQGLGALGFAVTVGVAIGGLASLAGRVHRGGPLVLVTIVLGPWLVASAFDRSAWSIPGALEAALTLFLAPGGGGS